MSHKSKEIPFLFLQKEHYNLNNNLKPHLYRMSTPRLRGFSPYSFTKYPLLFKRWQCAKTFVFFWLYLCPYKLFSPPLVSFINKALFCRNVSFPFSLIPSTSLNLSPEIQLVRFNRSMKYNTALAPLATTLTMTRCTLNCVTWSKN